jgi:hypothetical protein
MPTFILERATPTGFDVTDADQIALHSRWATDAYAAVGIAWLGGVATDGHMYSLVVAESDEALRAYCRGLGVPEGDYWIHRVLNPLGPAVAMSRDDPRYRPHVRPPRASATET